IEGMALATGDVLALYLPSLKPKNARVAWTVGTSAGLEFERPLHPDIFESLVLRHARPRERTETDRLLALDGGPALPAAALVPA
ncbi:MAG TPA: hypothetical protein VFF94_01320, partial [Novosphingobium sp.]|nr:hypothetical protein [Novosphingobium sp.]